MWEYFSLERVGEVEGKEEDVFLLGNVWGVEGKEENIFLIEKKG